MADKKLIAVHEITGISDDKISPGDEFLIESSQAERLIAAGAAKQVVKSEKSKKGNDAEK